MIIRKIRNNIVTKIPKDFGSSFVKESYDEASMASYSSAKQEIAESTAVIDVEPIIVPETGEVIESGSGDSLAPEKTAEGESDGTAANVEDREKPSFV